MSQRYRCNACLGEYEDVGPDGVEYFHVCPPVVVVTAKTDTGAIVKRPLRAYAGIDLVESDAERAARIAAGADPTKVWVVQARRRHPRKDARDETTLRRDGEKGEIRVIKAAGKGVTPIPPLAPGPEPVDDAP